MCLKFTLTIAGDVSDFDAPLFRSMLKVALAGMLGVDANAITFVVISASVRVEVTITLLDASQASAVAGRIEAADAAAFSSALGVTVEAVEAVTGDPPTESGPTIDADELTAARGSDSAVSAGVIVAIVVCVALAGCAVAVRRRARSRRPAPAALAMPIKLDAARSSRRLESSGRSAEPSWRMPDATPLPAPARPSILMRWSSSRRMPDANPLPAPARPSILRGSSSRRMPDVTPLPPPARPSILRGSSSRRMPDVTPLPPPAQPSIRMAPPEDHAEDALDSERSSGDLDSRELPGLRVAQLVADEDAAARKSRPGESSRRSADDASSAPEPSWRMPDANPLPPPARPSILMRWSSAWRMPDANPLPPPARPSILRGSSSRRMPDATPLPPPRPTILMRWAPPEGALNSERNSRDLDSRELRYSKAVADDDGAARKSRPGEYSERRSGSRGEWSGRASGRASGRVSERPSERERRGRIAAGVGVQEAEPDAATAPASSDSLVERRRALVERRRAFFSKSAAPTGGTTTGAGRGHEKAPITAAAAAAAAAEADDDEDLWA